MVRCNRKETKMKHLHSFRVPRGSQDQNPAHGIEREGPRVTEISDVTLVLGSFRSHYLPLKPLLMALMQL